MTYSPRKHIVFMEMSGIGNLTLATPALYALRMLHKESAEINLVCWSRSSRVLQGAEYLDTIADNPKMWEGIINGREIDELYISPVGVLDQLVDFYKNKTRKIHTIDVPTPWTKHEAEYKCELVGIPNQEFLPKLPVFDINRQNIDLYLKNISKPIIIINASYLRQDHWHLKHWGNKNYSELLKLITQKYDVIPILVGCECDKDDAQSIITSANCEAINACGLSSDIKDTVELINRSVLYIGNDSGLAHVSSAQKIPTITIFTFTNPIKNRPLGHNSHVLCVQCEKRKGCQHGKWSMCKENGCMDLKVSDVLTKTIEILDNIVEKRTNN